VDVGNVKRLGHVGPVGPLLIERCARITSDEAERYLSRGQDLRECIGDSAVKLDIEDGGIEWIVSRDRHCFGKPGKWPDTLVAELADALLQNKRNQRFVLDDKNAPGRNMQERLLHNDEAFDPTRARLALREANRLEDPSGKRAVESRSSRLRSAQFFDVGFRKVESGTLPYHPVTLA
jgi:hypothetical protein